MKKESQKAKISAIIVVRNEENKIRQCLDSLSWLEEIVIVDQSSIDNTVNICREYTDKVFVVQAKGYCEPDRALAAARAKNDWVLYLDADEIISGQLREEIISVLSLLQKRNSYYIPRKNYFLGKWIKGSGWSPGYVLRIFNKHFVKFSSDIHIDILSLTNPGYLKNAILHNTCDNLDKYLYKINSYTTILASQAYSRGQRVTLVNFASKLLINPLVTAVYKYIFKMGFRDGLNGFFIAFFTFLTVFMMNAKLWEQQKLNYKNGKEVA